MVEKNGWDSVKDKLHQTLTQEAWQNWVARTRFAGLEGSCLRVAVPDDATRDWLEREYAPKVAGAIRELQLPVERVQYELTDGQSTPAIAPRPLFQGGPPAAAEFQNLTAQLNVRFTFDNFVVGSCNQFAHAAAAAVAADAGTQL